MKRRGFSQDFEAGNNGKGGIIMRHIRFGLTLLLAALIVSGCGAEEESGYSYFMADGGSKAAKMQDADNINENKTADQYSEDIDEEESDTDETAGEGMESGTSDSDKTQRGVDEKLIYQCNIGMETVDFDKTIAAFRKSIEKAGGFVESEEYSNEINSAYIDEYVYGDYEKFNTATEDRTYNATVRIPSSKYNEFINNTEKIANVISKKSNVTNVTAQYTDLKTKLEIYEAQQKRLVKQLEKADDKLALQIESKLTDIQVQIAQLHNRMNEIDTDVDYSTVVVYINEVGEYTETPQTDTFLHRLKNTISDSTRGFLETMEALLMLLIRLFPYLVICLVVALVWRDHWKKQKDRAGKEQERAVDLGQVKETEQEEAAPQDEAASQENEVSQEGAAEQEEDMPKN